MASNSYHAQNGSYIKMAVSDTVILHFLLSSSFDIKMAVSNRLGSNHYSIQTIL